MTKTKDQIISMERSAALVASLIEKYAPILEAKKAESQDAEKKKKVA